jgi:hypothetical protein
VIKVTIAAPKNDALEMIRFRLGAALDDAMKRYAFDAAALTAEAIKKRLDAPRLADLRRSWRTTAPEKIGGGWLSTVYSDHVRAAFRETGGIVTAGKNAARCGPRAGMKTKALSIPQEAAKTSTMSKQPCEIAGLRWFPPKQWGNNRGILATVIEKHVARGKHKGKTAGEIKDVFFVLKKSVLVPPTPYYTPAVAETEAKRMEIFGFYARHAITESGL